VLLAVLMSLLPPYLRWMAKLGGAPTQADVEYRVSNYYFAFQVVQVFLVTTLTSAISGSIMDIIKTPSSAIKILASSIPTANNFYLSYMVLQGLGVVSGMLASVAGLVVKPLLAKFLGSTPRKLFLRWNSLSALNYGTVYPIYTNLLVIGTPLSICKDED
jgi:calcium permeable stress-gated cation channel